MAGLRPARGGGKARSRSTVKADRSTVDAVIPRPGWQPAAAESPAAEQVDDLSRAAARGRRVPHRRTSEAGYGIDTGALVAESEAEAPVSASGVTRTSTSWPVTEPWQPAHTASNSGSTMPIEICSPGPS